VTHQAARQALQASPETAVEEAARPSKWKLQNAARQLLPENERICACHRLIADSTAGVKVRRDADKAWFAGVAACGSVWICRVCAGKIGETRREQMQLAIDRCIGQGGDVALITLTFSHSIYHKLRDLLPALTKAQRKLKSGRQWQRIKEKYGIIGSVRALEITHGRNGWHPHVHEIEFFDRPLTHSEQDELRAEIFDLWLIACTKVGLGLPSEAHGVDVRGATRAAQYVGKWGFASELARGTGKTGWAGRTPWQLLEDYLQGDQLAGELWKEFSGVFMGRRQLFWSKGLRDHLEMGELFTDEELADCDKQTEDTSDVVTIDQYQWGIVCRAEARGKVLRLAMGPVDKLKEFLQRLRAKADEAAMAKAMSEVSKISDERFWRNHFLLQHDKFPPGKRYHAPPGDVRFIVTSDGREIDLHQVRDEYRAQRKLQEDYEFFKLNSEGSV